MKQTLTLFKRFELKSGPIKREDFEHYSVIFTRQEADSPGDIDPEEFFGCTLEDVGKRSGTPGRLFEVLGGYWLEKSEAGISTRHVFGHALDPYFGFEIKEGADHIIGDTWRLNYADDSTYSNLDERNRGGSGWTLIVSEVDQERSAYPVNGREFKLTFRTEGQFVPVQIAVCTPGGNLFDGEATVTLKSEHSHFGLKPTTTPGLFRGLAKRGEYTLIVKAGEIAAPDQSIYVSEAGKNGSAYLGRPGWPFYRLGENIIPFEPREDLIALIFSGRPSEMDRAREKATSIQSKFSLKSFSIQEEQTDTSAADDECALWLFQTSESQYAQLCDHIDVEIDELELEDFRIGMPVDLIPSQVKIIDKRFIVCFQPNMNQDRIGSLVHEAEGRIVRSFIQAGNAWLIEFHKKSVLESLQVIEKWIEQDLIIYGEPDLAFEIQDDSAPANYPNDPEYGSQSNLDLQEAKQAWHFLNTINHDLTFGSPNVYVMSLDRGIDLHHPDIGGDLTDGTSQIAHCYDFDKMQPCTPGGHIVKDDHGMGVFGIIAANTNNGKGIAGIAPNTHQIALKTPKSSRVSKYADILLWAAGITTVNESRVWPEPISPGADIICCSHGVAGLPVCSLMDATFKYLSVYGRKGKGALVIYSAGKESLPLSRHRAWAAHPRTMAIANSLPPDPYENEIERIAPNSAYGPGIDICAQGEYARSLKVGGGYKDFAGTSAAAPMVAATAALMLSVKPDLTWVDLRDILRCTAVPIDENNDNEIGEYINEFSQWYGYGRLNIAAAVKAAYAFNSSKINLVIRDNLADTGASVPTQGAYKHSPDIWVSKEDPAGASAPDYDMYPPHENALEGVDNWVCVRVKNIGIAASRNFFVRLYLSHFTGSQFQYPESYIPFGRPGDPPPIPLVPGTYLIDEQSVTTLDAGAEVIVIMRWPAPLVPAKEDGDTIWRPSLLAEVSPHTGPTSRGPLVRDNTNIAQRNVTIVSRDEA